MPSPVGLRPGERARSERVAQVIAEALATTHPFSDLARMIRVGRFPNWIGRIVRGATVTLKPFALRELDSENGTHAIHAVLAATSTVQLYQQGQQASPSLGPVWSWIVYCVDRDVRRRYQHEYELTGMFVDPR